MAARRSVIGVALAPPKVVELLRAVLGEGAELVEATHIRPHSSPRVDLLLVGPAPDWRVTEQLLAAGHTVVVLADTRDDGAEYRAIEQGASGYLLLSTPPATLRRALRAALMGEPIFHRRVLGRWLGAQLRAPSQRSAVTHPGLTPRQHEILGLIAQGATTKEIAGRLRIKNSTVDKHISSILRRVGVPNRAAAVGALRWTGFRGVGERSTLDENEFDEGVEQPASRA